MPVPVLDSTRPYLTQLRRSVLLFPALFALLLFAWLGGLSSLARPLAVSAGRIVPRRLWEDLSRLGARSGSRFLSWRPPLCSVVLATLPSPLRPVPKSARLLPPRPRRGVLQEFGRSAFAGSAFSPFFFASTSPGGSPPPPWDLPARKLLKCVVCHFRAHPWTLAPLPQLFRILPSPPRGGAPAL